jgi:hypothetical protein
MHLCLDGTLLSRLELVRELNDESQVVGENCTTQIRAVSFGADRSGLAMRETGSRNLELESSSGAMFGLQAATVAATTNVPIFRNVRQSAFLIATCESKPGCRAERRHCNVKLNMAASARGHFSTTPCFLSSAGALSLPGRQRLSSNPFA